MNVNELFNINAVAISSAAGTPASSTAFRERYIDPVFVEDRSKAFELDMAYGEVISDYQRDGFAIGFRMAVQLMADCLPGGIKLSRLSKMGFVIRKPSQV